MITELGHAALWLAAALALAQFLAPSVGQGALARPLALGQAGLVAGAFAALTHAFLTSDFSVALVAQHSHTLKPTLYKFTGVWANHEGSMLLWVTVLALAGAAVALAHPRMGERFRERVLQAQGVIALGFYGFLLIASNPFARLTPAPTQGNGLNPVLQDPGLAFHPPLLYAGYVGLSVAFAFAVAALLERNVGPQWARAVRPWVLAAWSALTAGIALGSFWAYYELGWGGYWFWDPVENASLMPWLAGTALLHSVAVLAKRDALRSWTVLLAVAGFAFSMVGTFLVRSGVLTSVHSFAVDPERGVFLLILLGTYIGGALTLYAARAGTVTVGAGFRPVSREGALVANNLLLSAILGVVLIGTLYPLAMDALGQPPISVGPPYFTATVLPLVIPLVLLLGVGPLLAWKRGGGTKLGQNTVAPAVATAATAVATLFLAPQPSVWAVLGFGLAAWVTATSLVAFARARGAGGSGPPGSVVGMTLAHVGIAVVVAGITGAATQSRETLAVVQEGGTVAFAGFEARLAAVRPTGGPNYTAVAATLAITRAGRPVTTLEPSTRTYTAPATETSEAGIGSRWDGDLYATLGKPTEAGWQVRLAFRPLVTWIWAGGLMIALGGLTSAFARARARNAARYRPTPAPVPATPVPPGLTPQPA